MKSKIPVGIKTVIISISVQILFLVSNNTGSGSEDLYLKLTGPDSTELIPKFLEGQCY
jgi:hypothetical protein